MLFVSIAEKISPSENDDDNILIHQTAKEGLVASIFHCQSVRIISFSWAILRRLRIA